jgi:CheY-like chemotaxis protein
MKRARVLIVDNHPNVREVLISLLDLLEIEAIACSGGEEALASVKGSVVDCVITDVMMPVMGGMDLVDQLKVHQPRIPVIMMSSYASEALAREAEGRGAVGLIGKPFKLEAITQLLQSAGVQFVTPA